MTKRSIWRLALTLLVCIGCGYFFLPLEKVRLGLDLRGGVHFELEVQGHEALEFDLRQTRDRVEERLQAKSVPGAVVKVDGAALVVDGVPAEQKAALEKALEFFIGNHDLAWTGASVRLTQKPAYQKYLKDDANKRALQIIENRVNQFGVAEPEITPSGVDGNRIVVELPGVGEAERERIKGLLSTPGRLELRMLAKSPRNQIPVATRDEALALLGGVVPEGAELFAEPVDESRPISAAPGPKAAPKAAAGPAPKKEERIKQWVLLEQRVQLEGSAILDARREVSPQTDLNEVSFTLNKDGAEANARVTEIAATEGRLFAFVLDRKIISILSAREKIIGGGVRISSTGGFPTEYADDLALKLKSGAMRASMKFLEEKSMGPSLGADSIRSGVRASLIGFLTIIAFMVFWYRWSGANAIVALTVNIIVMLGLMGSFHAVITLPGIAGFALTIGMAVDANILIFERIREELDHGKSVAGAIDAGFSRVFWTIVDSHVTQLFAALLLFIFGTGPVKGFAVTLVIGLAASMFTAVFVSHLLFDLVYGSKEKVEAISI